ncbi:glycoside hydrolase family 55 protein [Aulographum hederae CBS 113979]|uniref:Glycoside hydrolase family 55 protein n=1 Tax=Aulographum hederae CBS 113979 TaxID=1176131 RepID=A0A6G1H135_9PEZI|nr:glycoside hydrolase family 55 protein [Aulographum hederae CBS 113979]
MLPPSKAGVSQPTDRIPAPRARPAGLRNDPESNQEAGETDPPCAGPGGDADRNEHPVDPAGLYLDGSARSGGLPDEGGTIGDREELLQLLQPWGLGLKRETREPGAAAYPNFSDILANPKNRYLIMLGFSFLTLFLGAGMFYGNAGAKPLPESAVTAPQAGVTAAASSYWMSSVQRQGTTPFGAAGYKVFRNVKDYGAKGDGATDDTAAINTAIADGSRCGKGCDSSTVRPAIIYFPPGTYMVSKPLVQYYYTQMIGDAVDIPVIKGMPSFAGMALIDADPYENDGSNWFTNQNNFFRQVRNFVIDLTAMPATSGAGIHWQVAQATSLQNIRFEMVKGAESKQLGIFMDNGSGGFMTDLVFNGGNYGAFLGSQQFTTRNMTFNNCNTAIFMNWNWGWTLKSINVNNCKVGVDMANGSPSQDGSGGVNQTVGSVILMDSKFTGVQLGVNSSFASNSAPLTGGTLILDNVDLTGAADGVFSGGRSILGGGSVVKSWAQGSIYNGGTGGRKEGAVLNTPTKPAGLLQNGAVFERSKPQYEGVPASSFVSIKSKGAKGDGATDDTQAIQSAMNSLADGQILYFDHGVYIVTDTIKVPNKIKMTGEIWPIIMAAGPKFAEQTQLTPVFQVGQPGDTGAVEMSDMIFETQGNTPGAVLMQWNQDGAAGANGMWDVHFRVGGSAGTKLQSDTCAKSPQSDHTNVKPECVAAGLLMHTTKTASVYVENCWFWVADHELDLADHNQIDLYNGRGVLIESQKPTWWYGTASEHNVLYNYQLNGAQNVFMGFIQTETPYYQSNPVATTPFLLQDSDPKFEDCTDNACKKSWGVRVIDSKDVFIYGAGLYSFFENYAQTCVSGQDCQTNMVAVEGTTSNLNMFALSTKASVNMVTNYVGAAGAATQEALGKRAAKAVNSVQDADNRSNFCATLAFWGL